MSGGHQLEEAKATETVSDLDQTKLILKRVPLTALRPGVVFSYPIFSDGRKKLLGAGIAISEDMLNKLRLHEIHSVMVEKADLEQLDPSHVPAKAPPSKSMRCLNCGKMLPLRLPEDTQPGTSWVCKECGVNYTAHLDANFAQELIGNVHLAKFDFDHALLVSPSPELAQAVHSLVSKTYKGPERRASKRVAITIPVPVVPVDEQFQPVGEPFVVTTRNISTGGIAFVHNRPITPKFLVVELPAAEIKPVQVVVQVLRCRAIGSLYEIAGKFVMRAAD